MLAGDPEHDGSQFREIFIVQRKSPQRVVDAGIETRRDQHQIGLEAVRGGHQPIPNRFHDFTPPRSSWKRAIHCAILTFAFAGFVGLSREGIPRRLMRAEEEYGAIRIKSVLGPVAMVHIPICDEYLADSMFALGIACGDGDAIKDAEAHALVGPRVVAWGAHHAEGVLRFPFNDRIDRIEYAADRLQGDIQGARPDVGITGAEFTRTGADFLLHFLNVGMTVAKR